MFPELTEWLMARSPPAAESAPLRAGELRSRGADDHQLGTLTMFEMLAEASVRLHWAASWRTRQH